MYHEEQHEETLRQEMSSQYCHEREEDSQAPPELEPINLGYEQFQQQSMGGFGQETGYEPSADELKLRRSLRILFTLVAVLAAHLLPQSLLVLLLVINMLGRGRLLLSSALGPAILTMLPDECLELLLADLGFRSQD